MSPREGPAGGDSYDSESGKLMAFGTRTAPASPVGQLPSKTLGILVADKGLGALLNEALKPCSSTQMNWWETPHSEEWKCESSQKAQNSLGMDEEPVESLWVRISMRTNTGIAVGVHCSPHGQQEVKEANFRQPQEALCSKTLAIMGGVEGQDPGSFWHAFMITSLCR